MERYDERYGGKLERNEQPTCKSVFKSGENTTLKSQFTRRWIELINQIEKNKSTISSKR
jgi:hypothetical protein